MVGTLFSLVLEEMISSLTCRVILFLFHLSQQGRDKSGKGRLSRPQTILILRVLGVLLITLYV